MSLDIFLNKRYDERNYNCLHYAIDVWKQLTGKDLTLPITAMLHKGKTDAFKRIDLPYSPCIVMLKFKQNKTPHVGIYYKNRVWHITRQGIKAENIESLRLTSRYLKFYVC